MDLKGLNDSEVKERVSAGKVNKFKSPVSRSYLDIIVKNFCTTFNLLLIILGVALVYFEEIISALSATGIIALNVMISTIQEMKAKRRLDKIAVLLIPKVKILRGSGEIEVAPSKIVIDDIIHLTAGDQAQVDGELLQNNLLEMDESLLTGESSTRRKKVGDVIYSGAYCVSGEGYYKVTALGSDTYASQMLSSAKKFRKKKTPLQMETAAVTEMLMIIAFAFLGIRLVYSIIVDSSFSVGNLEEAVIILDMVPIALFLLITITYMIAAVRMANGGVLMQNSNSVESMSHVNTVCMDKTGTITTNNLIYDSLHPFSDKEKAEICTKVLVSCTGSKNRTVLTIAKELGTVECKLIEEIQFSSDRKYSAVRAEYDGKEYVVYMGAYPFLKGFLITDNDVSDVINDLASKGLRTVLICSGDSALYDGDEPAEPRLEPLCVISIRDEVRPDCKEIITQFMDNGLDIKVISGDDPETVRALFALAEIPGERKILSGEELDNIPPQDLGRIVTETNIFGRMKPEQKESVITTLRREGRYVAMVGDGVNDVRGLKAANVGIALQSGSGAARGVADLVMVDDRFDSLPRSIMEGKKTVTGMRDILRLYLTRNFVLMFLILILLMIFHEMPLLIVQNTYYALITVSMSAFLMAIWAKPSDNQELVLPNVLRFCIPTALLITVFGLIIYCIFRFGTDAGYFDVFTEGMLEELNGFMGLDTPEELLEHLGSGDTYDIAEINGRCAMLFFLVLAGISQLFMIYPKRRFMSPDGKTSPLWKPTILAFLLFGLMILFYSVTEVSVGIASICMFPMEYYLIITAVAVVWYFVTVAVLRKDWFKVITAITERFFEKSFKKEMEKNNQDDE